MTKKDFMGCYNKVYDTSKGFGNIDQWQNAFESRMNYKKLNPSEQEQHKSITQPLYMAINKDELRKEYYKLMLIHHPDKGGDITIAQLLNNIYFELKSKF